MSNDNKEKKKNPVVINRGLDAVSVGPVFGGGQYFISVCGI